MDNITINHILKTFTNINGEYLGIFTKSQLKKKNIILDYYENAYLILFIDNISRRLGHWVTVLKLRSRIYFLDSFGFHPKIYNLNLKHIFRSKVEYDFFFINLPLQSDRSTTCGAYVIYFIKNISICNFNILCFEKNVLKHFKNRNKQLNDQFVIKFIYDNFYHILPFNCKKMFCNDEFIIDRKRCMKDICKRF